MAVAFSPDVRVSGQHYGFKERYRQCDAALLPPLSIVHNSREFFVGSNGRFDEGPVKLISVAIITPSRTAICGHTVRRQDVWTLIEQPIQVDASGFGDGKEWTPYAFLVSKHGGLGLEAAKDQASLDALAGALPRLLDERISELSGRLIDADFLNEMVAPDAAGLILRWLNDPKTFQERRAGAEWKAFVQQCKSDFRFDPEKDGPLKAAQLLAERNHQWIHIWQRFADAPANYPGIVAWLKRASPKNPSLTDTAEMWPDLNARDERLLLQALEAAADRPQDEAIARVLQLEKEHGLRRRYPWRALDLSPLAVALEPLSRLAELCRQSPGAPNAEQFGELYTREGWRVDAAALDTICSGHCRQRCATTRRSWIAFIRICPDGTFRK
jgi:hypothetical protein